MENSTWSSFLFSCLQSKRLQLVHYFLVFVLWIWMCPVQSPHTFSERSLVDRAVTLRRMMWKMSEGNHSDIIYFGNSWIPDNRCWSSKKPIIFLVFSTMDITVWPIARAVMFSIITVGKEWTVQCSKNAPLLESYGVSLRWGIWP